MDLRTKYMGLELRNPLVASASPLSEDIANIKRMEDAGAAAVVMFSLFEEQIRHEEEAVAHLTSYGADSFAEALSYFPDVEEFQIGAEQYLELIQRARGSVDIPVIASLNGLTNEGWIDYAKLMQEAGANAIELNVFYIPADIETTGRDIEERYVEIVKRVKGAVTVPVALKLSPFFSAFGNMARRLDEARIDALVLFNRFYQPDFDIDRLEVSLSLELSEPSEIRLPLAWIAMLYGRVHASLAATRGVHSAVEIIKYVMAGADAVMTTSALLKNGIGYAEHLLRDLEEWMEAREYASINQMKGSMSERNVADPTAFKRGNYVRMLEQYKSAYIA
ncbi:MAG: dihydroorotate dehydrogenase-like protein [Betaproteobacteria bacterium]|nr:dihydroorotate dehydrogenase-like protein [Gammaproteobacteria bacterium]MDH3435718.1 dihydroorotate dehydrogenase-like protein [Betaproteobacteria bacterium]